MLRTVIYMLGAIIAITLLRATIGMIAKAARTIINPPKDSNTVDMVKCPSCGSLFAPGSAAQHKHTPAAK